MGTEKGFQTEKLMLHRNCFWYILPTMRHNIYRIYLVNNVKYIRSAHEITVNCLTFAMVLTCTISTLIKPAFESKSNATSNVRSVFINVRTNFSLCSPDTKNF